MKPCKKSASPGRRLSAVPLQEHERRSSGSICLDWWLRRFLHGSRAVSATSPPGGHHGSSTAKLSLKRLVQLAKPTVAARTTSCVGPRLRESCWKTSGATLPCRVHCSANLSTAFSSSL